VASLLASIPYFSLPSIDLGPISLQPFGMLVATGVLVGAYVARKRAETLNIDEDHLRRVIGWILVTGFIGAHIFDVLAYQMDELKEDPLLLIKVWAGISSYGGFIGGAIGFFVYTKKIGKVPVVPYADVLGWGLLVGFTFGRVGCAIVHDHLGRPAGDFFLAIDIPQKIAMQMPTVQAAGPHHDLGLYELIYLLFLVIPVTYLITRKFKIVGLNAAIMIIMYAAVRPFLDYFRFTETDPRYAGFTFAQWMSIVTIGVGVALAVHLRRHGRTDLEWAAELAGPDSKASRPAPGKPPARPPKAQAQSPKKKKKKGKK
jgi:phosphatidylglycerol---prolipoprotein diacylglyceryl transferase